MLLKKHDKYAGYKSLLECKLVWNHVKQKAIPQRSRQEMSFIVYVLSDTGFVIKSSIRDFRLSATGNQSRIYPGNAYTAAFQY